MIYLVLIVYLLWIFWGSLIGSRSGGQNPEGYFLANRGVKTVRLFFTIMATNFSAFYFLGFGGEGYRIGLIHYVVMAIGTALAGFTMMYIGQWAWKEGKKHGYITPADLIFGKTNNRTLSTLFSAVMILFTLPYLSLQVIGGGYLLESMTNGELSYGLSVLLLTVFTIAYVVIGGMQSVTKTDLKQGLMVVLFMLLAVFLIGSDLGGLQKANQMAANLQPDLFSLTGREGHYSQQRWFSLIIFWMFCIPMFPQVFMRFFIAVDSISLKKSILMYAAVPVVISLLPVLIGIWGHLSFPGLVGTEADQILPLMLTNHTHEWVAALIMTGAIAAFMSTLDSQLLAISTMFTRDMVIPLHKNKPTFDGEVRIGRILVAIFALIGLCIAYFPFDTIFEMGKMAFSGMAILFPVTIVIVRNLCHNPRWMVVAIIIGLMMLFGFHYQLIPTEMACGFDIYLPILLVTSVICLLGTINRNKSA